MPRGAANTTKTPTERRALEQRTLLPAPRVCGSSARVTDQPQHALVKLQRQLRQEERANDALVEDIAALTVVLGFDRKGIGGATHTASDVRALLVLLRRRDDDGNDDRLRKTDTAFSSSPS